MPGKPLELQVKARGQPFKNLPATTYALPEDNGRNLYERIAAKARVDINRVRITKASDGNVIPNSRDNTLEELGLWEQSTILVKDLGYQIPWKTVFLLEYAVPIIIHPLLFSSRQIIYKNPNAPFAFPDATLAAKLSCFMVTAHFVKRELETIFVHRFSNAGMPIFAFVRNSSHYWLLSGLLLALTTYTPSTWSSTARPPPVPWLPYLGLAVWAIGQLGNLSAHLTLRNLRTQGGSERGIPVSGVYRFTPVTCPNYFYEIVAWTGVWITNRSFVTPLFIVASVTIALLPWAKKKEARYRSDFGDRYKKKRFVLIPFVI